MSKTALVIVDVQNDYFPGGKWELSGQIEAAQKVQRLLMDARAKGLPIVHIQHVVESESAPFFQAGSDGVKIHESVLPLNGEPVITKHFANGFLETNLKDVLDKQGVKHLVVCGSMTHNCIDETVRAAVDQGYTATIINDACATLDMEHDGETIPAKHVHGAFMASLAFAYGKVINTEEHLET